MARFFITGSSDGLGSLTAQRLIAQGHQVVLHARNQQRAADAKAACPAAQDVLVADLTSIEETKAVAAQANERGPFDAVIHNAGAYHDMQSVPGKSGLPSLFAVNTLAPYILTCLMEPPKRLLFISSSMHYSGRANVESEEKLTGSNYSDSKLHNVMLANAFARRWDGVQSNSIDPGWVPTKMGGRGAPQNIEDGVATYMLLALAEGAAEGKTGTYWTNSTELTPQAKAHDVDQQEQLLAALGKISGVPCPGPRL